jgi:predicted signal transduction protein with EAL and GGDEF domain
MAERLVRDLRVPYVIGEHTITVSASIGIASAPASGTDAQEIVRNADVAMYMAKANGKSGFAVFDPGMHAAIRARHELGAQLQHAVDLDQLRLVYQPIVSLEAGRVAGLEALVRWQHPDRGLVAPGEFIEIAEENGAILPIGRWVLREACQRAVTWQRSRTISPGLFICVNVSAREIQQPSFVGAVEEALAWAGLEPTRLILEITETAVIKASSPTVATLEALQALGVRVVIDDFGTGYFSLSHLRQFPVDALKIASEFVQVTEGDSRSAALADAIVALGDSLKIATVAEGIETRAQAERMRALGCTYGQGYYFAKPVSADEVEAGMPGLADDLRWKPSVTSAAPHRRRPARPSAKEHPSPA